MGNNTLNFTCIQYVCPTKQDCRFGADYFPTFSKFVSLNLVICIFLKPQKLLTLPVKKFSIQ